MLQAAFAGPAGIHNTNTKIIGLITESTMHGTCQQQQTLLFTLPGKKISTYISKTIENSNLQKIHSHKQISKHLPANVCKFLEQIYIGHPGTIMFISKTCVEKTQVRSLNRYSLFDLVGPITG